MIIECEFTNASGFARERVVFLTGMQIMIDTRDSLLYAVSWDESKNQPMASIGKLQRAMHDSEFRIHLDRDCYFMTLARCLDYRWIIWFVGVDWRQSSTIYHSLRVLQRAFRQCVMHKRLHRDRIFSKATAAHIMLSNRLQGNSDVITIIIQHFMDAVNDNNNNHMPITKSLSPDSPLQWTKPHGDGQIFA